LIFLYLGTEITKYWDWVYEVVPPLPKNFKINFKFSEEMLLNKINKGENNFGKDYRNDLIKGMNQKAQVNIDDNCRIN
jgi:hypothetical protein